MTTACEMVWDPVRAEQVRTIVESATGQPCPCKRGLPCPFVRLEPVHLEMPTLRSLAEREAS
jgi:hypothetical protein